MEITRENLFAFFALEVSVKTALEWLAEHIDIEDWKSEPIPGHITKKHIQVSQLLAGLWLMKYTKEIIINRIAEYRLKKV